MDTASFEALFARQQAARWRVAATSADQRQAKLRALRSALMVHRAEAQAALAADFRKSPEEVDLTELYPVVSEIKDALRHLPRWMRPRKVATPIGFFGSASLVVHEPRGVVLIISPWNYPIYLTLGPLVSAIAAGNCAVLKPSEFTPNTNAFLRKLIEGLFPEEEVALVEGEAEVAQALLALPFDHIFFTGSPAVGKVVMKAAAEHLASVTLELGGKSPVLVDADANLKEAARKIAWGKCLNGGQTCVAPDYVLVHERVHDALVEELKLALTSLYGKEPDERKASPDLARIINDRHFERIKALLDSSGARIAFGGETDAASRYISPTMLTDVDPAARIMQEEIFGPLLPILKVPDMEAAVAFVNARPKPLALYIFSNRRQTAEDLIARTTAGGGCINDTVLHFAHTGLPTGGVNTSGFGKAHGIHGFQAFSNARGILRQRSRFSAIQLMYPPYTGFVRRMIDLTLRYF
jgi:aldehyde dehydrogenase (NAD+)